MCGRYTLYHAPDEIAERFEAEWIEEATRRRYNIAPTQTVPIIYQPGGPQAGGRSKMMACQWGLVPSWAKDPAMGNKLINARAETLMEKPSFKQALIRRRCLVPADGFYEWPKKGPAAGQPVYARLRGGGLFAFAGLWEEWRAPDGEILRTFTIITVEPNELISKFHHRMAAILQPSEEADWLNLKNPATEVVRLLRPYPAAEMEAYRVARAVNNASFDDPSCIAPVDDTG